MSKVTVVELMKRLEEFMKEHPEEAHKVTVDLEGCDCTGEASGRWEYEWDSTRGTGTLLLLRA